MPHEIETIHPYSLSKLRGPSPVKEEPLSNFVGLLQGNADDLRDFVVQHPDIVAKPIDDLKNTALHFVAARSSTSQAAFELLLKYGTKIITSANVLGDTWLHVAARTIFFTNTHSTQAPSSVSAMMMSSSPPSSPASPFSSWSPPLLNSSQNSALSSSHMLTLGSLDEQLDAKWLVSQAKRNDILDARNLFGETALHVAVRADNVSMVHELLLKGAASHIAGMYGVPRDLSLNPTISRLLSGHSESREAPSPAAPEKTEFAVVCYKFLDMNSNFENVILQAGWSPRDFFRATDPTGQTVAMLATGKGRGDALNYVITHPEFSVEDLFAIDMGRKTFLHHTCAGPSVLHGLDLLLQTFADQRQVLCNLWSQEDDKGWLPLHYLCANTSGALNSNPTLLQTINTEYDLDWNAMTHSRQSVSPLHIAIHASNSIVLDFLSNRNDIEWTKEAFNGEIPLHLAIRAKNVKAVLMLIDKRANETRHNKAEFFLEPENVYLKGTPTQYAEQLKKLRPTDEAATEIWKWVGGHDRKTRPPRKTSQAVEVPRIKPTVESDHLNYQEVQAALNSKEAKQIAKGGSSLIGAVTVHKALFRSRWVAIKRFQLVTPQIIAEYELMKTIRSPFCVQLFGTSFVSLTIEGEFYIVMEYCEKTSLYNILTGGIQDPDGPLTWKRALKWMIQATSGIRDLHYSQPKIFHRDLKSMNLLVDRFDNCKICDFGTARQWQPQNPDTWKVMRTTPQWCPPELLSAATITTKMFTSNSDMWSLGIIFWEILNFLVTGTYAHPFDNEVGFKTKATLDDSQSQSQNCYTLMNSLMNLAKEAKLQPSNISQLGQPKNGPAAVAVANLVQILTDHNPNVRYDSLKCLEVLNSIEVTPDQN